MNPRISLIIPAYNEQKRIGNTLRCAQKYFSRQEYSWEIIVVDDGSIDNTQGVVSAGFPHVHLIRHEQNRGKGFAVKTGMAAANGEFLLYYDADGSTPIEEIEKIWAEFSNGYDIVIGSRALPESDIAVRQSFLRENMGRMYNVILKLLGLTSFSDTQCGFKAFRRDVAENLFPLVTMNRFSFDAELLFLAEKRGYRIREIPIRWINSPDTRVRIIFDSLSMLMGAIAIRGKWMIGVYKI